MTASRIRWAFLAVIYAAFFVWYGGSGDPISPEEVEKYMAIAEPRGGDSEVSTNLREFMETDDGQEFVMVNLNVPRRAPICGCPRSDR